MRSEAVSRVDWLHYADTMELRLRKNNQKCFLGEAVIVRFFAEYPETDIKMDVKTDIKTAEKSV